MLEVESLTKTYQGNGEPVTALQGISFKAARGEVLGLLGRSGAGKSTLMRILRGMEEFESGTLRIGSLEIKADSPDEVKTEQRRITAIHLQREFGLWTESALKNVVRRVYSRVTGYEALPVEEDARYEECYEEARHYLRLVGLEGKANHLATILSGGEKQRLLIARQLAKKPELLLLDEPATMACPATKQEVLDAVKKASRELNLTTVVVSHLPEVHEYLADRIVWMERGRILDQGQPQEMLSKFLAQMGKADPLPPRPVAQPVIAIHDLYKRNYLVGTGEVLKMEDLNLQINRGETTALIGQSGSGKTTLLKMIEGLLPPHEGSIMFQIGDKFVDITTFSPERMEVRRSMGIMYQEYALMPGETVMEQIAYKLGVKHQGVVEHARAIAKELDISDKVLDLIYTLTDMPEEDAKSVLEKLGLTRDIFHELFPVAPAEEALKYAKPVFQLLDLDMKVLDKLPDQLSGGESVRVTIAILLAARPQILILDEPFGDIDPITLREVANALKRIQAELHTTILLVSHHLDLVKEVSHRAVLIEGGRLVMDGDPAEVCQVFQDRCDAIYLREPGERTPIEV